MKRIALLFAILAFSAIGLAQSIDGELVVVLNNGTIGGAIDIAFLVKGNSLGAENTLNNATVDIQYDTTALYFPSGAAGQIARTRWNTLLTSSAYNRSVSRYVNSNLTYIRLLPTGGSVNANANGTPAGYDIPATMDTLAVVRFIIKNNAVSTNFSIRLGTYQPTGVQLFDSHNNDNLTAGFTSPTMNVPTNLTSIPLPVEMTNCMAVANRLNTTINWTTATETNNFGFNVERKLATGSDWVKVGFVAGKGTSATPTHYSYVDESVAPGTYNYRVKQMDKSGASSYSKEMSVEVGAAARVFSLADNYPNPFNPTTNIEFTLPSNGHVSLRVYNSIGQEVATLFDGEGQAGRYIQAKFDATRLASGIYFARLQYGGKSLMKKMLLVK